MGHRSLACTRTRRYTPLLRLEIEHMQCNVHIYPLCTLAECMRFRKLDIEVMSTGTGLPFRV